MTIEPKVSDHAIVRHLERVYGLDLDAIRREILTPEREKMIRLGAKRIVTDEHIYIIDNGVIVTVLHKKNPPT